MKTSATASQNPKLSPSSAAALGQHPFLQQPLRPVYAVVSRAPLLMTEAVAALRARVLTQTPSGRSQGTSAFNQDELCAPEHAISTILTALHTLPWMAPYRWVHVSEAPCLSGADQAQLAAYVAKPATTSVLCLSAAAFKPRSPLEQALQKQKALFVLEPPNPAALPSWIRHRARQQGLQLEAGAAALLADLVGPDVDTLVRSLEKLALYVGDRGPIRTEDVSHLMTATREHTIFALTDAVGRRIWPEASRILHKLLEGGTPALMVWGMLARQLRQLIHIKALEAQGQPRAQLPQRLSLPSFAVDTLLKQASSYTTDELDAAWKALMQADARLKSSRLPAFLILERLLVDMMGNAA